MYVDFPDDLKGRCKKVSPRRELMATQLTPSMVLYADGKNKVYRPHPTHRYKATLFFWEASTFDQDFRSDVAEEQGYEPIVVADTAEPTPPPPAPPPAPEEPPAEEEPPGKSA